MQGVCSLHCRAQDQLLGFQLINHSTFCHLQRMSAAAAFAHPQWLTQGWAAQWQQVAAARPGSAPPAAPTCACPAGGSSSKQVSVMLIVNLHRQGLLLQHMMHVHVFAGSFQRDFTSIRLVGQCRWHCGCQPTRNVQTNSHSAGLSCTVLCACDLAW